MTWLWISSLGPRLSEAYLAENITPSRYLNQIDLAASATGYSLGGVSSDLAVLPLLRTVYRLVAFGLLRLFNRSTDI